MGWEGGPTAPADSLSNHSLLAALDLADRQEAKTTGIEIAAAAATGVICTKCSALQNQF